MKQDWMKQMRHQMGNYQHKVPEGLLDDIKKEMLRRGIDPVPAKKTNAPTLSTWAWRVAGIAALLAVAVLIGVKMADAPDVSRIAQKEQSLQEIRPKTTSHKEGNDLSNDKIGEFVGQSRRDCQTKSASSSDERPSSLFNKIASVLRGHGEYSHTPLLAQAEKNASEPERSESKLLEKNLKNTQEPPVGNSNQQEKEKEQPRNLRHEQISTPTHNLALTGQETTARLSRSHHTGVHLGAYYSGMGTESSVAGTSMTGRAQQAPSYNDFAKVGANYHEEKVHHHLPVKAGLQVRYDINSRWSLQTGLSYAYLSSDFSRYTPPIGESMHRRMHFIGIPVNASYSLYRTKRLNAYLTAGGEAQKMVSGKTQMESSQKERDIETTTEKVKMSQPQMSVNAAAGAEYYLTGRLSLYAEPGASYYFKNGSGMETYYTDKPLKFNLNVGLRFNIHK